MASKSAPLARKYVGSFGQEGFQAHTIPPVHTLASAASRCQLAYLSTEATMRAMHATSLQHHCRLRCSDGPKPSSGLA
eukprot:8211063-Pyramimonas_sp.AAC.1